MTAAIGAIFLPAFIDLLIAGFIHRVSTIGSASTEDVSLLNRFGEWSAAWERILQSPIIGHGFGVKFYFFDLTREVTTVKSHIHNTYLGILYRHGLIGLVLFLGFYIRGAWFSYRLARMTNEWAFAKQVGLISISCMTALALAASTEDLLIADEGALIIAFPAALVSGLWQRHNMLSDHLIEHNG
jgi:O-antigen ligase